MKRSILEQSWAVAKPCHAGAEYNRRARTVSSSDLMEGGGRQSVGSVTSKLQDNYKFQKYCTVISNTLF